jgi:tryptophan halogenase
MHNNWLEDYKFVIVGGGTAGWLTALFLKQRIPLSDITLIESSEIGILGAGEGTTPHIIAFLENIGIHFRDILKNCKGTIKTGIKFTNWSKKFPYYYHGFGVNSNLNLSDSKFSNCHCPHIYSDVISKEEILDNYYLSALAAYDNKILVGDGEVLQNSTYGGFALHFDARLLAEYLKTTAIERGIKHVDSLVSDFKLDDKGNISQIFCKDAIFSSDFVFDCTGFKRLIIGKLYKGEWSDYSKSLPMKKAIPFFIENKSNKIPPYTEAIAMNYGWLWKIPVQGRFGCGYVFDSDFIDLEEARQEIYNYLGYEIDTPRHFDFKAGSFKETWINNCIAIGLSSGFVEPLEATSIWNSTSTLNHFIQNINGLLFDDKRYKEMFNESVRLDNERVLEFLYFHYLTDKDNNEFWKNFKINNKIPELLMNKLDKIQNGVVSEYDFNRSNFDINSWYSVGIGNNIINRDMHLMEIERLKIQNKFDLYENYKKDTLKKMNDLLPLLVDHYRFLTRTNV